MKGIFSWPGFKQVTVQFERDARFCGETKWSYLKLIGLAMDGVQLLSIGLLGEYIGRIFVETKQRPLYLVQSVYEQPAKHKFTQIMKFKLGETA